MLKRRSAVFSILSYQLANPRYQSAVDAAQVSLDPGYRFTTFGLQTGNMMSVTLINLRTFVPITGYCSCLVVGPNVVSSFPFSECVATVLTSR